MPTQTIPGYILIACNHAIGNRRTVRLVDFHVVYFSIGLWATVYRLSISRICGVAHLSVWCWSIVIISWRWLLGEIHSGWSMFVAGKWKWHICIPVRIPDVIVDVDYIRTRWNRCATYKCVGLPLLLSPPSVGSWAAAQRSSRLYKK